MRFSVRSAAWLLPILLTGCFHRSHPAQVEKLAPPIVDALPPKPVPSPTNLPPTVISVPDQAPAPIATEMPKETPKPPVKHRKPPVNTTQVASNENAGVSAIGQLTSGDASDLRDQTENSIKSTERGLSAISRKLNDQELKTAAQIREFIKSARAALASGDVDGAHTLAIKARVLLSELSQ